MGHRAAARTLFAASVGALAVACVGGTAVAATTDDERRAPVRGEAMRGDHAPRPAREERSVAVTINPLALLIGRYGGNAEITLADHHILAVSGYLQTFSLPTLQPLLPQDVRDRLNGNPSRLGGEIGYRLYSGSGGTEGLFVGPSFVLTPLVYPRFSGANVQTASVELQPFYAPGAALDAGAQTVTSIGLTLGGGIGMEYLAYDLPNDPRRIPLNLTPHWVPRVLFAAGWSF